MMFFKRLIIITAFSFFALFIGVGYAELTQELSISGSVDAEIQDGVFISDVEIIDNSLADVDASAANYYFGTTLDSTVVLGNDTTSYLTFKVTFYNNSGITQVYSGATHLTDEATYDNNDIVYLVDNVVSLVGVKDSCMIKPNNYLTLEITFNYGNIYQINNNTLNSQINFTFGQLEGTNIVIIEGNSADNIDSMNDANTSYDGSNTQYRWTNWSSDSNDRGGEVTLGFSWDEAQKIDTIKLYHFIDAEGCDFPESISIYYYDNTLGDYVELTESDYSKTENWSNAVRNPSNDNVYTMTIDGRQVTFLHSYTGTPPITTLVLNNSIETEGIKVVLKAKNGYFVGLLELELYDDGTNIMYEN